LRVPQDLAVKKSFQLNTNLTGGGGRDLSWRVNAGNWISEIAACRNVRRWVASILLRG